ncbi:MAG: DUF5691 domain-containing protein [Ktedonobacteraceae bacterium]
MNAPQFVTTALVGTARQERGDISTGTTVDTLIVELPTGELERQLLLQAGAWAVYRQAGEIAEHIEEAPEPAPAENLSACSPAIARLLHSMLLGEHENLLPTALQYLREARLRLPYELLPLALAVRTTALQAAVFPVLGERGLWLSQFNPEWAWVKNFLPATDDVLPDDAETIWQEGTIRQRYEILCRLRAIDAAKARAWLEGVWKQEKAEARLELLKMFEVGLSGEDEPFLEKALDDRAASVRALVPPMLACILGSTFAQRMTSRADTIITNVRGKLKLELPTAFDKVWLRDGIMEKPQSGVGERSWWMIQILACIPPTRWEEQFKMMPAKLIEMADADKFGNSIIEGWSRAAQLFSAEQWGEPLWDWWHGQQRKKALSGTTTSDMRDELMHLMPARLVESKVLYMMLHSMLLEGADWDELLAGVPTPWSNEFGDVYLQTLRQHIASLELNKKNYYPYSDSWFNSLETAATRLPSSCFEAVLTVWPLPEGDSWQHEQWREQLQEFTNTLRIRQRLLEEFMK